MNAFVLRKKLLSHDAAATDSLPLLASPKGEDTPQPEPESLYTKTRHQAIGLGEELIQALLRHLKEGDITDLAAMWELLPFYTGVVNTANVAIAKVSTPLPSLAPREAEATVSDYVVNAKFLADCHAFLTSQPNGHERLHLVSGAKLSPTRRTLDYMTKVALDAQSAIGARANDPSLRQALMEFDTWGMALYGVFHSHPRQGPAATRPSSTDLETHERYERCYPLVGCIFVRDGYLRFFRHSSEPFTITICGAGVVPIAEDEHVFKIQHPTRAPRFVSYDTLETQE
jgi:proteasome lid subunit RPN8/RPN11